MEVWKDILGYEGLYQVSTCGNVRSLDRKVYAEKIEQYMTFKGKVLRQNTDKDGYKYVALSKQGKHSTFKVHRLVALAFIDNPCNYEQINHKDEIKHNNSVSNLEWCSAKYNNNYGTRGAKISMKTRGLRVGRKLSEETKQKMSESHKKLLGRPVTEASRKKISESLKLYNARRREALNGRQR